MKLKVKSYTIYREFTIYTDKKKYYWEHLGELDYKEYSLDWKERPIDYEINGLLDGLSKQNTIHPEAVCIIDSSNIVFDDRT